MSKHISLQNKYRPSTFHEVVGQEHITDLLSRICMNPDNLPTGTLFTAVPGSGKTTIARIVAKAINCTHETEKPCNSCDNCNLFNSPKSDGLPGHPDYYEVDATTYGSKDDIEELLNLAQLSPVQGAKRVILIDEVHALSKQAFDVMLKPLEEGLKHTIFLMATTELDKVRKAIVSRCPSYSVRPLSQPKLYGYLKHILESENVEYDEKSLILLSHNYVGKTRDAVTELDSILTAYGELKNYSEKSIYEYILDAIILAYNKDLDEANILVKETISYKSINLQSDISETMLALFTKNYNLIPKKSLDYFNELIAGNLNKVIQIFLNYDITNPEKLILSLCILSELNKGSQSSNKPVRCIKLENSSSNQVDVIAKELADSGKFS